MAARAQDIGDLDASAPANWDPGLGTGEAHMLVTVNAQSASILEDALSELRGGLEAAAGLSIVAEVHAELLKGTREHFGFADGFSQPAIEGVSDHKAPGEGVPLANGWRALAAGEFILGYEDEESRVDPKRRLPSAPDDPLGRNGTYMVWRKLYQDVALFRRTVGEASHLIRMETNASCWRSSSAAGRTARRSSPRPARSPRASTRRRPVPTISATATTRMGFAARSVPTCGAAIRATRWDSRASSRSATA